MQHFLKVSVFAFEGVHDEAVEGEKVHSASLINYFGFGYFRQLQKLFSPEFNSIRAGVLCCCGCRCPSCHCHPSINLNLPLAIFLL
jgi:hypothetical protein